MKIFKPYSQTSKLSVWVWIFKLFSNYSLKWFQREKNWCNLYFCGMILIKTICSRPTLLNCTLMWIYLKTCTMRTLYSKWKLKILNHIEGKFHMLYYYSSKYYI